MKEERLIGNSGIQEVRQQGLQAVEEIRQSAGVLNDFFHVEENPEYLEVSTDEEGHVIEGTQLDGTKEFKGNVEVKGSLNVKEGLKYTGSLDSDSCEMSSLDIDEFVDVKVDRENRVLECTRKDGTKVIKYLEVEQMTVGPSQVFSYEDVEGRICIGVDKDDKVIWYRKKDGTLVEKAGIETPLVKTDKLELTPEGITDLEKALKANGFTGGQGDWSDYLSNDGDNPLIIPNKPKRAIINLKTDFNLSNLSKVGRAGAVQGVNYDIPTQIEFWDMQGNYFKKWALISGQGNSSMAYAKKNIAIDLFDTSVYDSKGKLGKGDAFAVKFGEWVPQDSYHLKANIFDSFRYVNHLAYQIYDAMVKTRGIKNDYVWKRALIDFDNIGTTTLDTDVASGSLNTGARCFPDGFPVVVYQNGNFWGLYFFSLKKHRDNYHLSKKDAKHIHLDGLIDDESLFMANGNIDWEIFCSKKPNWEGRLDGIEVRNPKDLYCMDGEKYDADLHNEELIDSTSENYDSTNKDHVKTAKVKKNIEDFSKAMTIINEAEQTYLASEKTAEDLATLKSVFETYFDVDNLIDYMIHGDLVYNWDGFRGKNWQWFTYDAVKWYVGIYDCDEIFGCMGNSISYPPKQHTCLTSSAVPAHTLLFNRYILEYYTAELEARYAELREKKVLDADFLCSIISETIDDKIGKGTYEMEWEKWNELMPLLGSHPIDSIYRYHNWITARISDLDDIYNYNV